MMAKSAISRCHELNNDHTQYGDGFVRKLTMKFNQATCNNEHQRSAPASAADTAATNCLLGTGTAAAVNCNHDDAVTSLFVPRTCQTNHKNSSNAVLSKSSATHVSTLSTANGTPAVVTGKYTMKHSDSATVQLMASNDLAEDGECRVGIVASARRLFESLSSPASSFPCCKSPAGSESTLVTRQNTCQTSDSEAMSSGYSSLSTATNSSQSLSSQTNVCSSNSAESSDNTVSSDDLTSNTSDTAPSDAVSVGLSDTNTSHYLSPATTTSDSLSSCDDVLRDEVFLAVESRVTSDAVNVNQSQTDHQIMTLYNTEDASPACIQDFNRAVITNDDQDNLLETIQDGALNGVQEETSTMHFDDLPSKHEIISEINMNIYKTSTSEYGVRNMLSEREECSPMNSTEALQSHLLSTSEHGELQTDSGFEAVRSVYSRCLDDRNHFDINSHSFDCATTRSAADRQLSSVDRHRTAPVRSNRPMYCSVIHIGSKPDDVVIETYEDPPRDLPPAPDNRRYVTQSVSLRITEPRDQPAASRDQQVSVIPRRRERRSRSDHVQQLRPVVVCGSTEYISRTRPADDADDWHNNDADLMTSHAHLLTAALVPVTRRSQVCYS